ncbi:MAG: hypothetical protein H8E71_04095 [Candidatus Marinimicrobia bacterium]|nr:hypothetical protein [Candidatus Neomarinimicrobiota bacterium]
MKNQNYFIVVLLLILFQCEDPPTEVGPLFPDCHSEINYCTSDVIGNLILVNNLDEELYLYVADTLLKYIPDSSEFVINLVEGTSSQTNLKIIKANSIDNPFIVPENNYIFKQWNIIVTQPPQNNINDIEKSWVIEQEDEPEGFIILSYPENDEWGQEVIYNVDIVLDTYSGPTIACLQPGQSMKEVRLTYNTYYIYLHYWWSDPESSGGVQYIGWNPEPDVDSEPYDIVLNTFNDTIVLALPTYENSSVGRYGIITIQNSHNETVIIKANGTLIENYAIMANPQNASSISVGSVQEYLIPEDVYSFVAITEQNVTIDELSFINIIQRDPLYWDVNQGNEWLSIDIQNNTQEVLVIKETNSDDYLGYTFQPGEIRNNIQISTNIELISAVTSYDPVKGSTTVPTCNSWNIVDLNEDYLPPNDISNLELTMLQGGYEFTWNMPNEIETVKIIRNSERYPISIEDGDIVLDDYSDSYSYMEDDQDSDHYYYRFFSVDAFGNYSYGVMEDAWVNRLEIQSEFSDGDIIEGSEITLNWEATNIPVSFLYSLDNALYEHYASPHTVESDVGSVDFVMLDDSDYVFKLNALDEYGNEYGEETFEFTVNAFSDRTMRIQPWQSLQAYDSSFTVDIVGDTSMENIIDEYKIDLQFDCSTLNVVENSWDIVNLHTNTPNYNETGLISFYCDEDCNNVILARLEFQHMGNTSIDTIKLLPTSAFWFDNEEVEIKNGEFNSVIYFE